MSAPHSPFRAAAAQMTSTDDLAANLAKTRDLARQAADAGCRFLSLPECFCFLGRREADKLATAEVLDPRHPGPILQTLMEIATRHGMWVSGAGIPERVEEEAESPPFNTLAVVSPTGELAAVYRKIHLFDVDIPGGATLRESDATSAGSEVVSLSTDLGPVGLSICYDLRFPELYRALVTEHGAEMVLVPAAFTAHTGAAHWHILLRARAIENQCFVIAAGQTGRHNDKRESYGHSMIIDPWGTILAEVEAGEGLAIAEIDLSEVTKRRQQMPCLEHRVLGR